MHSGKWCGIWQLFFTMAALRVILDHIGRQGAEGWMGMEEVAQPFGFAHRQSWKAQCTRNRDHETKEKTVVWAL